MKHQALFSSKDKSKKLKCRLLQVLFGALRVSHRFIGNEDFNSHNIRSNVLNSRQKSTFIFIC